MDGDQQAEASPPRGLAPAPILPAWGGPFFARRERRRKVIDSFSHFLPAQVLLFNTPGCLIPGAAASAGMLARTFAAIRGQETRSVECSVVFAAQARARAAASALGLTPRSVVRSSPFSIHRAASRQGPAGSAAVDHNRARIAMRACGQAGMLLRGRAGWKLDPLRSPHPSFASATSCHSTMARSLCVARASSPCPRAGMPLALRVRGVRSDAKATWARSSQAVLLSRSATSKSGRISHE